jgi:TonB family protein
VKAVLFWNLATLGALGSVSGQEFSNSALTLGVHLVTMCGSEGASAAMQLAGSSNTYCLKTSTIVDQRDVASAGFDQYADDKSTIKLVLQSDAAQRFRELTIQSMGLQVGVVINGQLVSVAKIVGPSAQVWIAGLPQNTAESVIQVFQSGRAAKTSPPGLPSGRTDSIQPDAQGVYRIGNGVTPPIPIRQQDPEYTPRARAAKIQGIVVLEVVIMTDGTPDNIRVVLALDPDLDAKAIECARSWRFRPALRDGKPVPVRVSIQLTFHL